MVQRPGYLRAWLLVAAVTMAACSASTDDTPSAGTTTAGTTTAGNGADVVVGEGDSGTQVSLRPGQRLRVSLGADYTPLETSADGALAPVDADGGYPTGHPLTTVLTAVTPGEVSLSSATDATCLHESPPCSLPQQEWTLSVTVAAG
jgi:hypothetical protein